MVRVDRKIYPYYFTVKKKESFIVPILLIVQHCFVFICHAAIKYIEICCCCVTKCVCTVARCFMSSLCLCLKIFLRILLFFDYTAMSKSDIRHLRCALVKKKRLHFKYPFIGTFTEVYNGWLENICWWG